MLYGKKTLSLFERGGGVLQQPDARARLGLQMKIRVVSVWTCICGHPIHGPAWVLIKRVIAVIAWVF